MNEVVKTVSKDWFEQEIKKAAEHWRKGIDLQGDYVEKYFVSLFHDSLFYKYNSLCRTFGMPLVFEAKTSDVTQIWNFRDSSASCPKLKKI